MLANQEPRWALALPLVAAVAAFGSARADDLTGYAELRAASAESREELFAPPALGETSTDAIDRRLYFLYNRQPYPRLRFWLGGTFDDIDATTRIDDARVDSDERRLRPYVGLGQSSRPFTTQLSWNRDDRRVSTEGTAPRQTIRDSFFATLAFTPQRQDGVRGRLLASRNYDRDAERLFRDVVRDSLDLEVAQQVTTALRWAYRGTLTRQTDELADSDATTTSHRAEVGYSEAWLDRRVLFDSQFTVNRRESVIDSRGAGEVELPLFPLAALAGRDDTPLLITLPPEPALLDDDLALPTPIDLGLPAPGGDERPWALAVDFGTSVAMNTFFVWLDRDVRPEIAGTFSWQVYTSANNLDWVFVESLSTAPYDEFLRRFVVRFGDVQARFVKLVVEPLDPIVPGATDFPDIFVTELDPFQRIAAPTGRIEVADTFERLILNTRARLLARRELYYEGAVDSTWTAGQETRYNMRHGLFFLHPLAPEAELSTRVAYEQFQQTFGRDEALTYSAALVVTPVETVQYTVSVSGREERMADELGGDQIGVLFYGRATLFRDVYLQLGASRNYREDPFGNTIGSTLIDVSARIEPRPDLIFTLYYDENLSEAPRPGSGLADVFTRAAEANATWTPVPSIYLYGQLRREWRSELAPDTLQRLVASWAPFPASSIRLGLNYDESWRELNELHTRVAGPFLRWNVNPRSYLQLAYTDVLEDSLLRRLRNEVLSAILRWGF